jgi:hypothetical protein
LLLATSLPQEKPSPDDKDGRQTYRAQHSKTPAKVYSKRVKQERRGARFADVGTYVSIAQFLTTALSVPRRSWGAKAATADFGLDHAVIVRVVRFPAHRKFKATILIAGPIAPTLFGLVVESNAPRSGSKQETKAYECSLSFHLRYSSGSSHFLGVNTSFYAISEYSV